MIQYTINRSTQGRFHLLEDQEHVANVVEEGSGYIFKWVGSEAKARFNAIVNNSPYILHHDGGMEKYTHDMLFDEILTAYKTKQWEIRACKKGTVFRLKNNIPGTWRVFPVKFDRGVHETLRERYGSDLIEVLNVRVAQD